MPLVKLKPLTSVVVATDFSPGAQVAFERALRLPLHPKAKVTLVNVIPDDIPGKLQKQANLEAMRQLEKLVAREKPLVIELGLSPSQIRFEVLEGSPAKQLSKRAKALEAEVIVLGRTGRRKVAEFIMGSTAQRVVREAQLPVLVVQSGLTPQWSNVVTGLELDSKSTELLELSAQLAPDATIVAFHASQVPFEEFVTLEGPTIVTYRDEFVEEATKTLKSVVKKSGVIATPRVRMGDPRVLLLEEAKSMKAGLVVVGTHARKGLKRLFLGSVAEWVLGHATGDVLVSRV